MLTTGTSRVATDKRRALGRTGAEMAREATGGHRGTIVLSTTAGAEIRRTNADDESSRYFMGEPASGVGSRRAD